MVRDRIAPEEFLQLKDVNKQSYYDPYKQTDKEQAENEIGFRNAPKKQRKQHSRKRADDDDRSNPLREQKGADPESGDNGYDQE